MPPTQNMPHSYSRRILVAVEAYSPQTITETLYALTQTQQDAYIPTEIHIITTIRGHELVKKALLDEGRLIQLCADYALPMACQTPHFHLIDNAEGEMLWDVRTQKDNEYTADFINGKLQQFTADPTSSVCVLLSGGRRTMTYFIGYALSLFGRAQDRLKHVIVDDCYFFLDDFFYPPPYSFLSVDRNNQTFDMSQVNVILADIPFVRLRYGLPEELLTGNASFSGTIAAAQRKVQAPSVQFCWQKLTLMCGEFVIEMQPVQLAFYVWMLIRHSKNLAPIHWTDVETPPLATQFLDVYTRLFGMKGAYLQVSNVLKDGLTKAWFEERKSKTHQDLKSVLGKQGAFPYLLQSHGSRPVTRVSIGLPKDAVQLLA